MYSFRTDYLNLQKLENPCTSNIPVFVLGFQSRGLRLTVHMKACPGVLHSRQALCGVAVKSFMSGVVLPRLCRLIHSVTLSRLLNLSVPQFTHL